MGRRLEEVLEAMAGAPEFQNVRFAGVATVNALGDNLLHVATRMGDLEAVRLLLAAGVDVNQHGSRGYTPLHCAAERGLLEIVEYLLAHGADPFARTEGDLPYVLARTNGHAEVCDRISETLKARSKNGGRQRSGEPLSALNRKIQELQAYIDRQGEKPV